MDNYEERKDTIYIYIYSLHGIAVAPYAIGLDFISGIANIYIYSVHSFLFATLQNGWEV